MKALILAAGLGTRLHPRTLSAPKCLLPLHGKPVMEHQLDVLASCGVVDVTVVVGHLADTIRTAMGARISTLEYSDYASTNNLHTLHSVRQVLDDDTIILFADVLLPPQAVRALVESDADFGLLVDTTRCLEGTMRVKIEDGGIVDLGSHVPVAEGDGNFVGVARYSRRGAKLLAEELNRLVGDPANQQKYYIAALPRLAGAGERIVPIEIAAPWIEIDTEDDYRQAAALNFYVVDAERTR